MKDITELNEFIQEADAINDTWRTSAKKWTRMHRGDQWRDEDRKKLEDEDRPVLTFNLLRPLIRLLTGIERKSRYDIKVLPTGDGSDHNVARLLTEFIRQIERDNNSPYIYSEAYKLGLITGRGWIKVDVNYDRNIWGDIVLENVDPYEIWVDPYTQKADLSDSRYEVRELYFTADEISATYPEFENRLGDLEKAPPEYGDPVSQQRTTYKLYEMWYKEYENHYYAVRFDTGDVIPLDQSRLEAVQGMAADNENLEVRKFLRPEMYYAIISRNEILEQGRSPYNHNMFPYTPFFCDFNPRLGDLEPVWHSIITDLVDPQREKNKRFSMCIDILVRFVNKGFYFEEGAVTNEDDLDDIGRAPGFKIKLAPNAMEKFKIIEGSAPDQMLLQLSTVANQEIDQISGVHPAMKGYEESSRESGRVSMLRQQQGQTVLTPYQDNMRMARYAITRQMLALIPQVYTVNRMIRMISDEGNMEEVRIDENIAEKMQNIMQIKNDPLITRYDISIADVPSTPTTRQTEFVELIELIKEGLLPITPNIIKLLLKTSDISIKSDLLDVLEQEMQQAQQQQQQQQVQEAMLK